MYNFCTLFDSNYINYGLAMYESLKKHCKSFHLYIFAFDDKCYEILKKLYPEYITIISLSEFEDEELLKVKPSRSKGEYCWTCTSSTILYCLKTYNLESCTYLDSDLYFYSDPGILIEEMGNNSVLITEHRYTPEYDQTEISGKYCVQFITFKNDGRGLKVLEWWKKACIDWCFAIPEDGKFGDQKYLDNWTSKFEGVHELQHLGGGIAPWNVQQYDIYEKENNLFGNEISSGKEFKVIFTHFHNIKFLKNGRPDPQKYRAYKITNNVEDLIYTPFLKHLMQMSKKINIIDKSIKPYKSIKPPLNWKGFRRKIEKNIFKALKSLIKNEK
jgi:hypothetical protein